MVKEAHTPGPWEVSWNGPEVAFVETVRPGPDGDPQEIFGAAAEGATTGEAIANAHLCAAAPCMKSALRALLDEISGTAAIDSEAAGKAFAALAKAEGRATA
tara:strand:+ start:2885 stop:3190 length:306 start_codon:yes stop_codon:yes gene_type:complete